MKWQILLLPVFLSTAVISCVQAQVNELRLPEKGDATMGYTFSSGMMNSHQITVDYFIHPRWSLLYRAGYRSQKDPAVTSDYQLPIGASTGVGLLALTCAPGSCGYFASDLPYDLFRFSCLIPDGISYHLFPAKGLDISPYVLFSGLSLRTLPEGLSVFYYSPSAGIRAHYAITDALRVTVEQQFRREYQSQIRQTIQAGIAIHLR
jgi:hypothetical protein